MGGSCLHWSFQTRGSCRKGHLSQGALVPGAVFSRGTCLRGTCLRGTRLKGHMSKGHFSQGALVSRGTCLRGTRLRGSFLKGQLSQGVVVSGADVIKGAEVARGSCHRGAVVPGALVCRPLRAIVTRVTTDPCLTKFPCFYQFIELKVALEQLSPESPHPCLTKSPCFLSISRIYGSPGAIVTRVTTDASLTLSPCYYQFLVFMGAFEQLSPESPQILV